MGVSDRERARAYAAFAARARSRAKERIDQAEDCIDRAKAAHDYAQLAAARVVALQAPAERTSDS